MSLESILLGLALLGFTIQTIIVSVVVYKGLQYFWPRLFRLRRMRKYRRGLEIG